MHIFTTHRKKRPYQNQIGALFGMDARIALVVFTLLTGTLGYFSYGKLKAVRDTAVIKELTELNYALQAYQTDMNTFIPFTVEDKRTKKEKEESQRNDISILWEKDALHPDYISLWNGPYMSISSSKHKHYGEITLTYLTNQLTPCTAYTNCFVYIGITDVPEEVWIAINHHFDENMFNVKEKASEAHLIGRIRADGLGEKRTLYFKSIARE